jgi:hypothetical protein
MKQHTECGTNARTSRIYPFFLWDTAAFLLNITVYISNTLKNK